MQLLADTDQKQRAVITALFSWRLASSLLPRAGVGPAHVSDTAETVERDRPDAPALGLRTAAARTQDSGTLQALPPVSLAAPGGAQL